MTQQALADKLGINSGQHYLFMGKVSEICQARRHCFLELAGAT